MPDGTKQIAAVEVASDGLARNIRMLASETALLTKPRHERRLTEYEINLLDASKHYIEIALNNDRYWKEGNVA